MKDTDKGLRDFIIEECSIMVKLNHPNIVKFLGACLDPSQFFIVTEYLPRGSLSKLMGDRNYKYELDHIRRILMDTAAGMIYLHDRHIIHRDLKPGNLLLTQDWITKVADFGLSRALPNAHITQTLTSCGTITYTAPEVLRDQRYSLKADIWSFGIIALSLITRTKPYPKMTDAQIVIRVLAGKRPSIPPKVPKEFTNIIKKCLKNDPKLRPSFQQIHRLLETIIVPKPNHDSPVHVREARAALYASGTGSRMEDGDNIDSPIRAKALATSVPTRFLHSQIKNPMHTSSNENTLGSLSSSGTDLSSSTQIVT